ncbi:hypothetical protein [Ferruginivarius sediminum]|uniref:Diaminopimelate decarboxylase n=1 Tax=Ferruginivarius sediminum TaxID=2661937 RepID=A0A369TCJ6_9PROT|nr:hypothetical protein [Ferruginivarius sediminum]RDD61887.1 hypothetical protein DRB17_10370 [Ferruginivarius sediminum]
MAVALEEAPTSSLDRAAAEVLARQADGPYYLLDLDRIRANHAALMGALQDCYPGTEFAYSVKTNYTPRILALVLELGGTAEVVSEMEYRIARRVGFPAERIMVNGPLHAEAFLRELLAEGVRINLDGWYTLAAVERFLQDHPARRVRVGLRLNTPLPGVAWSRFGFATDEASMQALAGWFREHPDCELAGLHGHCPLAPATVEAYRARIDALIGAARKWFPHTPLSYLDVGGGFRKPPEGPPFPELAQTLADAVEVAFPAGAPPSLVVEPGTAIVADAIDFVCRVHDVKQVGGRTLALIDGSVHDVNTMMWRSEFDVRVLRGDEAEEASGPARFDVAGNTCMERKDIVCQDVPGPVRPGDMLLFKGVGSYSNTLKPPFIHPCPAVIAQEGGDYAVVKRREAVDDILATYTSERVEPPR